LAANTVTRFLHSATLALAFLFAGALWAGPEALPPGEGRELVQKSCTQCHAIDLVLNSAGINRALWEDVLLEMEFLGMQIEEAERKQVLDYLAVYLGPDPPLEAASKEPAPARPAAPAELYEQHCGSCHGPDGRGAGNSFPPLAGNPYVRQDPRYNALVILYGLEGPIKIADRSYNGVMPPLAHLAGSEIAALAAYVMKAWGEDAGESGAKGRISEDEVRRLREKTLTPEEVLQRRPRLPDEP